MNTNPWVSGKVASQLLGITEEKLDLFREIGYLKAGTHWRTSPDKSSITWKPIVVYHLNWCKEEIEYWLSHNAPLNDVAA